MYTDLTIHFTTPEGHRRAAIIPAVEAQMPDDPVSALSLIVIALNDRLSQVEQRLADAENYIAARRGERGANKEPGLTKYPPGEIIRIDDTLMDSGAVVSVEADLFGEFGPADFGDTIERGPDV